MSRKDEEIGELVARAGVLARRLDATITMMTAKLRQDGGAGRAGA